MMTSSNPRDQPVHDEAKLLDQQWERQQVKSFSAWVNSHLTKAGMAVEDLSEDFKDGKKLIKLVELISNEQLAKPEKGKMRLHHIQNLNTALKGIEAKNVRLVGTSAEEIADGNMKIILGMIWVLILRFQIADISVEEMSAKEGLLLWCQRKTAGYAGCDVKNFHTSWQDGNAFCALIHKHRPDLLTYDELHEQNPETRLNTAFKVAEQHLDIPQMLDTADMIQETRPDERSVMTYVAMYYHAFAGMGKTEEAARRLETVLSMNREFQEMIKDYDTRSSTLMEWLSAKQAAFEQPQPFATTDALQEKNTEFGEYKKSERPPKSDEKVSLEAHYSTLQTKLRLNNRPPYNAEQGVLISDIDTAWKQLEQTEKDYAVFLENESTRLEKLQRLSQRFEAKARFFEKWIQGKQEIASSDNVGHDLPSVQALVRQLKAFRGDVKAHHERPKQLATIAQQLQDGGYEDAEGVQARANEIAASYDNLNNAATARKTALEESLAKHEQLDEQLLDFATRASNIVSWCEGTQEDLMESLHVRTMQMFENEVKTFEATKADIDAHAQEQQDVIALGTQLEGECVENPYTQHSAQSVQALADEISELVTQRDAQFVEQKALQESREKVCKEYAEYANPLGEQLDAKIAEIRSTEHSGSLEEQLAAEKETQSVVEEFNAKADGAHELASKVSAEGITQNPHAQYTSDEIAARIEQLNGMCTKNINTLENQILMRDQSGISEEKMQEYKESFKFFDKNRSGVLDRLEFRSCLLSTGYDLPDVKGNDGADPAFDLVMAVVDPEGTGQVSFEAFADFAARDKQDATSSDQFKESFKIIAGDKDYITEEEIRRDMSPATADYIMSVIKPKEGVEGGLDYLAFTDEIFQS
ncbi:hypothetical protein SARC_00872 [Sphaeroforma arctica JP610]|uniref:Alpha-actinin n=1 Tax=Sphaeroforma arctica JP610 TaxID=667725 RepID=A0A0L0GDI7_9EUKA|nr:hypothetical protein SARC_00872 [Sphaeroforma arctica JP610]KNC86979.1 hypothetical protein SARC_00872 [Sphaeroforma arctica JP610]|eukprot:XP_014160881.1 hypothetical protein SARC_00872 [Sphaeroforma arctica JP610]